MPQSIYCCGFIKINSHSGKEATCKAWSKTLSEKRRLRRLQSRICSSGPLLNNKKQSMQNYILILLSLLPPTKFRRQSDKWFEGLICQHSRLLALATTRTTHKSQTIARKILHDQCAFILCTSHHPPCSYSKGGRMLFFLIVKLMKKSVKLVRF